jgi:hypothetical protein
LTARQRIELGVELGAQGSKVGPAATPLTRYRASGSAIQRRFVFWGREAPRCTAAPQQQRETEDFHDLRIG